jgi:hypothetical protein
MPGLESALRLLESESWEERLEAGRLLSGFDDPRALDS